MSFSRNHLSHLLSLVVATTLALSAAHAEAMSFRVSAIGYHPQGAKVALLEDIPMDSKTVSVTLFDPARRNPHFPLVVGATVHKIGKIRTLKNKGGLGPSTNTLLLDFSDFKLPGTYELRVEGTTVHSEPIKITDYLYWDALKPLVRSFYFQRCGQEIEAREQNLYHAACHVSDARPIRPLKSGSFSESGEDTLDVAGGWHNGGDYAKYALSTALASARLMAMSEWEPRPFRLLRLDYPMGEPGYGVTDDFHHEIRVGLDWLMSMQRKDGALWRKVAGRRWPEQVKPEDDIQPRFVYGVSTQDTAAAAATWAMAARSFRKADLGYSVKSLMAAEKAWEYLESQPRTWIQRSADDFSGSGEFFDARSAGTDQPYRLWAAAELYISTGKTQYHTYLLNNLGKVPVEPFSWRNPAIQGIMDYLLYADSQEGEAAHTLKRAVMLLADGIVEEAQTDAYAAGLRRYGTSSNGEIAERGAVLMAAFRLSGEPRYREAATQVAHYFFGINPLGLTYVTGLPGRTVQHPAHRWMAQAGKTLPGFLVDGPNELASDGKTPKNNGAESYADDVAAVGSNEPRLMNNASLACLLSWLNASYNFSSPEQEKDANTASPSPLNFKLAPERPSGKRR